MAIVAAVSANTDNGKSASQQLSFKVPSNSYALQLSSHEILLSYYSKMDDHGKMSMHFELSVEEFLKPPSDDHNVRMCMGLREKKNEAADTTADYKNSN